MRRILYLITILLFLLAGCMQTGDSMPPPADPSPVEEPGGPEDEPEEPVNPDEDEELDPEAPEEPEDPDDSDVPTVPEEPETVAVTVLLPEAAASILADGRLRGHLDSFELRYQRLNDDDEGEGQVEPDPNNWSDPLPQSPGETLEIDLTPGLYEFETRGFSGFRNTLVALGSGRLEVTDELADFQLEPQAIIGYIRLVPSLPTDAVVPGSDLNFDLIVYSTDMNYLIRGSEYSVEYAITGGNALITDSSQTGATVSVSPDAAGELEIIANVTGLFSNHGVLLSGQTLSTEARMPISEPLRFDWLPPKLVFDEIGPGSEVLTGRVSDDVGLASLEIFEGETLLGSTKPDSGAGVITFTEPEDESAWELAWSATGSTHLLKAIATDMEGNKAFAFRSLNAPVPEDENDLSGYISVSSVQGGGSPENLSMTGGYCAANELTAPGQGLQAVGAGLQAVGAGLQAVGAVGGLFMADTQSFGDSLTTTSAVADALKFKMDHALNGSSTILVVDDFGPASTYGLPADLLAGTLTPEELADLAASGQVTHGALVLHHFESLLSELQYVLHQASTAAARRWNSGSSSILLKAVNIHGLSTTASNPDETIPGRIRQALTEQPGVGDWVVVNMSFVMMPCGIQEDLEASGIHTFEDYVLALAEINGVDSGQLLELATEAPVADPLLQYLDCPFDSQDAKVRCLATMAVVEDALIHVAAAGNYGAGFSLYPAAANNAISVSSMDTSSGGFDPSQRSAFSNRGGVLAPGALFELASTGGTTIAYAGTSFAAPIVSVFTALDLQSNPRLCYPGGTNATGIGHPNLASQNLFDTPFHTTFGSGGSAINAVCQGPVTN